MIRLRASPPKANDTLNNCAAGWTPWGTYLTCEENFNGYFGWNGTRTPNALENRYGIAQAGFGYLWHTVDPRFDVNATPNEPNRFGWVGEVDPHDPASPDRPGPSGFGLSGMAERVRLLGGTLNIRSAPGQGTTVETVLPERPR